jgi:two-component system, sensor histidine kinase
MKILQRITSQLLAMTLLPFGIVGGLFAGYYVHTQVAALEREFAEDGQRRVKELAHMVDLVQSQSNAALLGSALRASLDAKHVLRVAVIGGGNQIIAEQRKSAFAQNEPRYTRLFQSPTHGTGPGAEGMLRAPRSSGRAELALDARALKESIQSVWWKTSAITLLLFGLACGFAFWRARQVAKPIRDLTETVRKLAVGDLRARVEPGGAAEFVGLGLGVNNLARSIGESQRTLSDKVEQATAALKAQRDEASNASQAKSRFLAAASHDLRQPMHALGLFCSALVRKVHEPEQKSLIGNIQLSLQAMEGLFESLLDLSRLEAGRVQANMSLTSLSEVLQWLANEFGPAARDKGLRFRVRPSQEWGYVDPTLLRRILLNLTSNAIRYTETRGILIGVRKRGEVVRFEVWDTGRGIHAADLEAIFDEFVQVEGPGSDKTKGLGLGLAIAQKSAHLMGTRIHVESRKGRGSVFSVDLLSGRPTRRAMPVRDDPDATAVIALRVLVIEDDEAGRHAMTVLLEHWSCEVKSVEGVAGLDEVLANNWIPQLIVSDFRLRAKETGPAVIEEVERRLQREKRIPVVIVSGELGLEETFRTSWPANWDLLKKPVSAQALRASMNKVLSDR